jgi:uncharacterized protein (DUF2252 family)
MNKTNMNTIIKRRALVAMAGIVAMALMPMIVFAHGGEEHVIGTVTSISDTSVTVKTTAGKMVEVGFDTKTTFARAKQTIQKSDIKVGERIVIHAVEANEKLVAHTVEIGAGATAKH